MNIQNSFKESLKVKKSELENAGYIDLVSFKSAKYKVIETQINKLPSDTNLQKIVFKATGGNIWYEDHHNDIEKANIKTENLKYIDDLLKNTDNIKRIETVLKFNTPEYRQIEELQKNSFYLAQHMCKNYNNFKIDLKEIKYERDLTNIKFTNYYDLHQWLIAICTFLNITIAFITAIGAIIEISDHNWYMFLSPSIAFINSCISSLINHWNLGLVSSNLSALMVEQSQLIKSLRKYNRMIESKKPLMFQSIEKTTLSLEEFSKIVFDLDSELLENFCNVKSTFNTNISFTDKIKLEKTYNNILTKSKCKNKLYKEKSTNTDSLDNTTDRNGLYVHKKPCYNIDTVINTSNNDINNNNNEIVNELLISDVNENNNDNESVELDMEQGYSMLRNSMTNVQCI